MAALSNQRMCCSNCSVLTDQRRHGEVDEVELMNGTRPKLEADRLFKFELADSETEALWSQQLLK